MFFDDSLSHLVFTPPHTKKESIFLIQRLQKHYKADFIILHTESNNYILHDSCLGIRGGVEFKVLYEIVSQICSQNEQIGTLKSRVIEGYGTPFFFLKFDVTLNLGERGQFVLIRRNHRLDNTCKLLATKEFNLVAQNITSALFQVSSASIQDKSLDLRDSESRIMLVDDSEMNRIIGEVLLNELGFDADHARDGREAVELCKRFKYDLILMDFHMPIMTGPEAAKVIKELVEYPLSIFACTSDQSQEAVVSCFEAGMSGLILKPLTIEKLQKVFLILKKYHWEV